MVTAQKQMQGQCNITSRKKDWHPCLLHIKQDPLNFKLKLESHLQFFSTFNSNAIWSWNLYLIKMNIFLLTFRTFSNNCEQLNTFCCNLLWILWKATLKVLCTFRAYILAKLLCSPQPKHRPGSVFYFLQPRVSRTSLRIENHLIFQSFVSYWRIYFYWKLKVF